MFEISNPPDKNLAIVVTIPCYNELGLIKALNSLNLCDRVPYQEVEVLTVINASENSSIEIKNQNEKTYKEAIRWATDNKKVGISFYFHLDNNLPKKHAGVGLARKIAMDVAYERLESVGNIDGVISCYDADSSCEDNYLVELFNHFNRFPKSPGCSIYFEHPISGDEFSSEVYSGIINYEAHLRYYNLAVKFTGYPGAFHTVGSSMAVRAYAYKKQGGMNRKKAGEDFYFLHKIISLGNFTELKTTKVIPSPRPSDRVPFGTGRAISQYLENTAEDYTTYSFGGFAVLKRFFSIIPAIYNENIEFHEIPIELQKFLTKDKFELKIQEIKMNSTTFMTFNKRFYAWFNAFQILKFVHFYRDNYQPNGLLSEMSNSLLNELQKEKIEFPDRLMLLKFLRDWERR